MIARHIRPLALAGLLGAGVAAPVAAVEPETSVFLFVSDLLERGFTPFGTSGETEEVFGMTNGSEIYLCYSVDSRSSRSPRQQTFDEEMANESPDRTVHNIALACALTQ